MNEINFRYGKLDLLAYHAGNQFYYDHPFGRKTDCPYPTDSIEGKSWLEGFECAVDEDSA